MPNKECSVCVWERKEKTFVSKARSNQAWADTIGCSEASVRRHYKHAPSPGSDPSAGGVDAFLTDMEIPQHLVTTRGMSIRDPETGSWQKVTWQPNAKALHDSLQYDDLAKALEDWSPSLWVSGNKKPEKVTSILNAADLQIGKANQRGGGTAETLARARQSIATFVEHVLVTKPEVIVLADVGDPIENVFNVPSQLVTNDLDVPEQIRVFRRLMLEAIKTLAPLAKIFIYVSVPSNHGAFRTGYKSQGGTVDADFGLEISYQLEDAVRENPHLENVQFVRPRKLDETAVLDTSDSRLLFNHGHQSGGVFKHGVWWGKQDHGRQAGWDAGIGVFAHFHTQAMYQSGNGRHVIACGSCDPGSDWFTNGTGESALPGMTAFDVRDNTPLNVRLI